LADELDKTAAFYQSRHPENKLSPKMPLLLTGDLALAKPASGLLKAEVKYDIEDLIPPLDHPTELTAATYMVNLGLALKKQTRQAPATGEKTLPYDININIFADKYRKIRAQPIPFRNILLLALLVIAITFIFPLQQSLTKLKNDNTRAQIEFSDISRELNLVTLIAEEASQTETSIQEITAATAALEAADRELLAGRGIFIHDLTLITAALPPSTDISSLEIDNETITVSGETASVFDVVNYAIALERTGTFTDVRIREIGETTNTITGDNTATGETATINRITFDIVLRK
jgi:Tfp pilus assembly protein PilN